MATKVVFITGPATTFTIPSDFGSLVSIEAIGGGGGGSKSSSGGGSGGGGYAKVTSILTDTLTPSAVIPVQIGAGGTLAAIGGDTAFGTGTFGAAPSVNIVARGGGVGATNTGGAGGFFDGAGSGTGLTGFTGGTGGAGSSSTKGGGGGAAGPSGNGANGGNGSAGTVGTSGQGGGGGANAPGLPGSGSGTPGTGGTSPAAQFSIQGSPYGDSYLSIGTNAYGPISLTGYGYGKNGGFSAIAPASLGVVGVAGVVIVEW